MTRVMLLVATVIVALVPQVGQAYNYSQTCGGGQPAVWDTTSNWYMSSTRVLQQTSGATQATAVNEVIRSFDEWTNPGCSAFSHSYQGTSATDPLAQSQRHIVGFYESGWPYGRSTLGVTLTSFWSDCTIAGSDMVMNAQDWTWVIGQPSTWSQADLRAVVTHEAGHWLGMDHSTYSGSSLFASYSGGIGERDLTCDDTMGVCRAYPSGSNTCSSSKYCDCGVQCVNGTCGGEGDADTDADSDSDADTDTDTDTDTDVPTCSGNPVFVSEQEPNGWQGDTDVNYWVPDDGGDFTISGTVSCGNNGDNYTADSDWFVVDFPCQGNARFELDWGQNADLDFYVWDTTSNSPIELSNSGESSGPIEATAFTGQRVYANIRCWSGSTGSYDFLIDWSPFDAGGDADTDADADSDADSDSDSDADADSDSDADTDTDADSAPDLSLIHI